jgi:hypothetical protein
MSMWPEPIGGTGEPLLPNKLIITYAASSAAFCELLSLPAARQLAELNMLTARITLAIINFCRFI